VGLGGLEPPTKRLSAAGAKPLSYKLALEISRRLGSPATMWAGRRPKRSARRKTKHLVLPRPLGRQVGEASNPHAMRQPAID
jgi:hypothetical protein